MTAPSPADLEATVRAALARAQRDDQLLSGRDYSPVLHNEDAGAALAFLREQAERVASERDEARPGGRLGRVPDDYSLKGESYWQRQKLDASIRHLRDLEDFYRLQGGTDGSYNMVRADRARAIYEQISDDYLNGKMDRPSLKERAESAEARVRDLEAELAFYADEENWTRASRDYGEKARASLHTTPSASEGTT